MDGLFAALFLAIAVVATDCARLTRANRSYWPMLRVMWSLLILAYGGSGIGLVMFHGRIAPLVRVTATLAVLVAVCYSDGFMRRRNRVARYLPLTVGGQVEMVGVGELWQHYERAISLTQHGTAPAAWVAQLEAATAEWHRQEAGRVRLRQRRDAMRRERGIPEDD